MWEKHPGLKKYVEQIWEGKLHENPFINFSRKPGKVRKALKRWYWEVFGDLRKEEQRLSELISLAEGELQNQWTETVRVLYRLIRQSWMMC